MQSTKRRASEYELMMARLVVVIVISAILLAVYGIAIAISLHSYPSAFINDTVAHGYSAERAEPMNTLERVGEIEYKYEFLCDLSEYEQYMNPAEDGQYIILVNYESTLPEGYKPDDLVEIPTREGRETQTMRETPAKALEAFLLEARANGVTDVTVTSGWRSYNTQVWLLDNQVSKYTGIMSYDEAYALAITEVAIPGTSEHQSGLCVDMHNLGGADISFAESASAKWLADNCYKFGFILRYPADKVDITRISFEPWHFRFVGRYHASVMHENGMCLEEYVAAMNGAGNE